MGTGFSVLYFAPTGYVLYFLLAYIIVLLANLGALSQWFREDNSKTKGLLPPLIVTNIVFSVILSWPLIMFLSVGALLGSVGGDDPNGPSDGSIQFAALCVSLIIVLTAFIIIQFLICNLAFKYKRF